MLFWFRKGLYRGIREYKNTCFRLSVLIIVTVIITLNQGKVFSGMDTGSIDILILFTRSGQYYYNLLVLISVMCALEIRLKVQNRRVLLYGNRRNMWVELVGKISVDIMLYFLTIVMAHRTRPLR